ncbi:monocarboxylate transporter 12-like isoform X2 [Ruditapes philippinarum]|uniref:monocarboxylate transporter 12-like isoform X2 n=1 Tax=Ruditapes philippinarum TaxID=129788 RepID=UPI00295C23ED|nr:monocarboxylate transporter 12-like isoform X2 [Ruditapes philippinarum]
MAGHGASLEMFLLVGIVKSSGILFVAFQEKFYSSSSVTSLLSTVQNICQSIMALIVMTFGIRFTTCRTLLFIGSTITCLAYVITSQATDIRVLLFSHGVLQGIGAGCMQPTALTMVSLYFEKRRSLANSIAVSGGPVGGLIFAPLITRLLSIYGYQGCVLILAGILMNGCISGALFRPTTSYDAESGKTIPLLKTRKLGRRPDTFSSCKEPFENNQETLSANEKDAESVKYKLIIDCGHLVKTEQCDLADTNGSKKQQGKCCSHDSQEINVPNGVRKAATNCHNSTLENIHKEIFEREVDEQACIPDDEHMVAWYSSCCSKDNFKLIKNPVFYAFLIQGTLICSGTVVAPIFIAPYAKDIGIDIDDAATLVTTQSCIDLLSRVLIGYISDKGWVRRSNIVAFSTAVISLSSCLLGFYTNYTMLLCYSIVLGLVSGVYFSLFAVVLIDYLTLAHFQTCLGFMALVHGFSVAGSFYLVGFLRDISGSYVIPHQVIGGATGVGTIILFLLPVIQSWWERHSE